MFAVAVAVVIVSLYQNIPSLIIGLPGLALASGAGWWLLTEHGARRVIAAFTMAVGLVLLLVALGLAIARPEHWFTRVAIILLILGITLALGRYSVARSAPPPHVASGTQRPQPPAHPVLLCNPWSGGGKVESFGLVDLAGELGIEVVLLDRGLDLADLTRDAVARGADCLGMAGGDGSQALVASISVEHDLPFVCIPAGTRNHFALDLGLDRDDPRAAMAAFRDAVERRIDYATVNDRLFVNNVSLGIYATIVQSDEYRDSKVEVTRSMLNKQLGRQAEPFDLQYTTPDGEDIEGAFLIMVSNNPYVLGPTLDVAQRRELDTGSLGVFAISTATGSQAARVVTLSAFGLRNLSPHWYEFDPREFEVRSQFGSAYMGVDGEALEASTPLQFKIHPQGLRMFMPEGNAVIAEKRRARNARIRDVATVAMGREPELTVTS